MTSYFDEKELLARLDDFRNKTASAYCDRPIGQEEILRNVFRHVDEGDVQAVMLRGSRATGRQNPYSDVDVAILQNIERKNYESFKAPDGVLYSLVSFGQAETGDLMLATYCRGYYGMKPIYDPEGAGKRFADRLDRTERAICAHIPKENPEYREYLYQLTDFLERTDEDTAIFVKAKLMREFPAFLAAYNGFNLIGYKNTIDCLIRDNRELALLYAAAMRREAGALEIRRLLDCAFQGLCGLNVLNTDFSHSEKANDIRIGGETMYHMYSRYTAFMEYMDELLPNGMEKADFFMQCKEKAPKLFEILRSLI